MCIPIVRKKVVFPIMLWRIITCKRVKLSFSICNYPLTPCFSNLALLTFWAGLVFVMRGYQVHCRMFYSISGLCTSCQYYSLVVVMKNVPPYCQMSLGGQNLLFVYHCSSCFYFQSFSGRRL